MTEAFYWVWGIVIIYWIYCIGAGVRGARMATSAGQYIMAGRQFPMWAYLLAATAASFSGWTFVGHPGLIWQDGLAYAFCSFYVLTIPITGTFFLKRQWLLGKRYGFVTPGDMYSYYYGTETMRVLGVVVAFIFAAFYAAVQFMAAGVLFHWVTGVPVFVGAVSLALVVLFYVGAGGLRSVGWVDSIQCVLLILGIMTLGYFTLNAVGGWQVMSQGIAALDAKMTNVPGIIEWTVGERKWTGIFILTYLFALMGIQASPAFTLWAFANKNPRPFAWQQFFMSTVVVGVALVFFSAFQGLGAHLIPNLPAMTSDRDVVPALMQHLLPVGVLAFVTLCALAAMQSTASPYIGTGSTIVCRDVVFKYLRPQAGHKEQIWTSRGIATIITAVALIITFSSPLPLVMLGAFATALGFMMYLPLLGVVYGLRVTGVGVATGLLAGIVVVILTEFVWRYPLTIHNAGWGILAALVTALVVSYFTYTREGAEKLAQRKEIRDWLHSIDGPTPKQKAWRRVLWVLVPLWFLFAIGPFTVLANSSFSFLGFPPIWSWQIVWWMAGIVMMWALCFKAGLSTITEEQMARVEKEFKPVVFETEEMRQQYVTGQQGVPSR